MTAGTEPLLTRALAFFVAVALGGCPQPIEVDTTDLRADAAVAAIPPRPMCKNEPREVGPVPATAAGGLAAKLVAVGGGALLVRPEAGAEDAELTLRIDRVGRDGAATKVAETHETGAPGALVGLDAIAAGGEILVALTRPGGRVDLLRLSERGETRAPLRTTQVAGDEAVSLLWHDGSPALLANGRLTGLDGAPVLLGAAAGEPRADAGTSAEGGDAGPAGRPLPGGLVQVVPAGQTLGWIRRDDSGVYLEHWLEDRATVLSTLVAPPDHDDVRLLWAGDRYLVGDTDGADIARFVVASPRGRRHGHARTLRLGGRMSLPHSTRAPDWTVWDNAGARHVGIAARTGPRRLEFVNVALGGLVFDPATTLIRQHEVTAAQVLWDGSGYVLLWSERESDTRLRLFLTRFRCPDEQ